MALILINFKNYPEAIGRKAVPLAKQIAAVTSKGYTVAIAPTILTLQKISEQVRIPLFAQHLDPFKPGAHTGSISIAELKDLGIRGTILNHSERKLDLKLLEETVRLCKKKQIKTVVCAASLSEVKKIARMRPNYIAYEPPALVGGEVSVTSAKPDIIVKAVEAVRGLSRNTKLLCGAGVHTKEDLGQALLLGAAGVLIGHSVPEAQNPGKFLKEMLL